MDTEQEAQEVVTTSSEQDATPVEELDLTPEQEEQPEETSEAEDVETLKQRLAETERKNKELYARLQKVKPKAQPKLNSEGVDDLSDIRKTVAELAQERKVLAFARENQLVYEEAAQIFRYNPNPTKETLSDPFIKGGLSALRARTRIENATPSPSGRSTKVDGKTWAEMSDDERRKNWDKMKLKK